METKTPATTFPSPRAGQARGLAGVALAIGLLTPSSVLAIPFGQRVALRGEVMLSHVVSEPITRYFGFGFFGSARLGLTLVGPLSLQAAGSVGVFPPAGPDALGTSVTATYTGGVRFEPRTVRPEGRLFIEGNAGVAATGADFYRFAFDVGDRKSVV